MAHFAQLDNNKVIQVLRVPDEQEHRGQEFLAIDLGLGGTWIQTSYNNNIRGRFAGLDYTYDPVNDIFIEPCPVKGYIWNGEDWVPPTPKPNGDYVWSEKHEDWKPREEVTE